MNSDVEEESKCQQVQCEQQDESVFGDDKLMPG